MKTMLLGDQNDNTRYGQGEEVVLGFSGDDTLAPSSGSIVVGGAGDDVLRLPYWTGSTFLFGRGDGHDRLTGSGVTSHNVLHLAGGLTPNDIALERSGDGLTLRIKDSGDSVFIEAYFVLGQSMEGALYRNGHVERIRFDDGQAWDHANVLEILTPRVQLGDGANVASGASLDGMAGNDILNGTDGADQLLGGGGDDALNGGLGNDFMEGGAGNDVLTTGGGRDVLRFARGWGQDTVQAGPDFENAVQLEMKGMQLGDLEWRAVGNDLLITRKGSSDSITVPDYYSTREGGYLMRERAVVLHFDNGSDRIPQYNVDYSALPAQNLVGSAGDDILAGGAGFDLLSGGAGDDHLSGLDGDDVLVGGGGNDTLLGGEGNDTLDPGAGDAVLNGGAGNNLILFGRTAGLYRIEAPAAGTHIVVLDADVLPSQVSVSVDPDGYALAIAGTGARIIAPRYATADGLMRTDVRFQFADGTQWSNAELATRTGEAADSVLYGTAGADLLQAREGADLLSSGAGEDVLRGGAGDDILDGGAGSDLLDGGTGADVLAGGLDGDTYLFARGDGHDDIRDGAAGAAAPNVIRFGAGIIPGDLSIALEPGLPVREDGLFYPNIPLTLAAGRLRIAYGQGDSIMLDRVVAGVTPAVVDRFEFADGARYSFAELFDMAPLKFAEVANQSTAEGKLFSMSIPDQTFVDVDGDPLRLDYAMADGSALPAWLSAGAGGILSGTPGFDDSGVLALKAIATDTAGHSVESNFTLTVANVNRAPVMSAPAADLATEEGKVFTVATPRFADPDSGDALTVTLKLEGGTAALPAWMRFDPVAGTLSGTAGYSDAGTYQLRATATDKAGLSVASLFSVTVADVNRAPVLQGSIATLQATETYYVNRTLAAYVDPDNTGATLSYSATLADGSPLPAWLSFDSSGHHLFGKPGDADTGSFQIRYSATEAGGLTASTIFTMNVANINQAPLVKELPAYQTVEDGAAYSLTLSATMFSDPDAGDGGVLSASGMPAWLSFHPQTRSFSGTPALADVGYATVKIVWTDTGGLKATADLNFAVKAAASVNLAGTAGADVLTGRSNNDTLDGAAGNDTLDGGLGADTMRGGLGDDSFRVDQAGDQVIENAGEGTDTVVAQLSYTLTANVENLTLAGSADLAGTGNALNNTITGNGGANVLDGGAGSDSLAGGGGNDTYLVGSGDTVTEAEGAGTDHVITALGTTLGIHVEALTLTGSSLVNGTGNALGNLLKGNSAANTLNGLDGIDLLQGGAGDDTLSDTAGLGHLFDGGLGADRLTGGAGRELFIGGAGSDTITTGTGADILAFNRGHGADIVNASTGADNVISLGAGIVAADLVLRKSGQDLILATGSTDQVTFKGWYAGSKSVGTLQLVLDSGAGYQPGSGNVIADNKVELFDFAALVARFDARGSGWTVAGNLAAVVRSGSDTEALGGDLAYAYAHDGNLATIGMGAAIAIIGSATFGTGGQLIGSSGLNDGTPMLF